MLLFFNNFRFWWLLILWIINHWDIFITKFLNKHFKVDVLNRFYFLFSFSVRINIRKNRRNFIMNLWSHHWNIVKRHRWIDVWTLFNILDRIKKLRRKHSVFDHWDFIWVSVIILFFKFDKHFLSFFKIHHFSFNVSIDKLVFWFIKRYIVW